MGFADCVVGSNPVSRTKRKALIGLVFLGISRLFCCYDAFMQEKYFLFRKPKGMF